MKETLAFSLIYDSEERLKRYLRAVKAVEAELLRLQNEQEFQGSGDISAGLDKCQKLRKKLTDRLQTNKDKQREIK